MELKKGHVLAEAPTGVGAIVQRSIVVFTVLKLAGAAYVLSLGVQAIRRRRALVGALGARLEPRSIRRVLGDAVVVGVANPKSVIFFAAVLPQFVDRPAGHVTAQLLLLGAVLIGIGLVSDSIWALVAGTARSWLARSPRRLEVIGGAGGAAMIGIGARLALTGRDE